MKIKYANEFIINMRLGDSTTCLYQFIYDENDSNDTNIIQYCIMHGLRLWIKLNSFLAHIFYEWLLSNNTAVTIYIKQNKYFISLNTYTTVIDQGDRNSNKIEYKNYFHLYDKN